MEKLILFIIFIVIVAFALPVCFTKRIEITSSETVDEYKYSDYGEVKLLHKETGEIEQLKLDDYLLGVVSAEMPADFEEEALKAQAVVARTYTIFTIKNSNGKHDDADICDDSSCCQAWISEDDRMDKWDENLREDNWKKIEEAVLSTQGKIIEYNGEPIDAFFHANSGGKTEEVLYVWGGNNLPYLKSVETSGEADYQQYSSEVILSKEEFESKIKEKHSDFKIDYNNPECIKIMDYTAGDRVKEIKIGNLNLSGVEVRIIFGLKSANFDFKMEDDSIKFEVRGYGHGVGMSQTGANTMAKEGKNYEEIIKHFYTDVEIVNF